MRAGQQILALMGSETLAGAAGGAGLAAVRLGSGQSVQGFPNQSEKI